MQTALTNIGNEVLKQLDQIVSNEIDGSLGTGGWLESVEFPDNIVTSSYFFHLYDNLYSLPDFVNQQAPGTGTDLHENIIIPSTESTDEARPADLLEPSHDIKSAEKTSNHNPAEILEQSHDDIPINRIEADAELATGPDPSTLIENHIAAAREYVAKPSQVDPSEGLNDTIQTTEKTEFDLFSAKTETYKSGLGSFSDLANEFLPAETTINQKKTAREAFTQPGNDTPGSEFLLENEAVKSKLAEGRNIGKNNTGQQKNPPTLSNVLEQLIQEGKREEILELAKVFADLLNNETINWNPADVHRAIHEVGPQSGDPADIHRAFHKVGHQLGDPAEVHQTIHEVGPQIEYPADVHRAIHNIGPQLYDEKHNALPATGLFPRATETQLFEEVDQDNLFYSDVAEPIVTWLKSPDHEAQRVNPADQELKNMKLYYRRYYGI